MQHIAQNEGYEYVPLDDLTNFTYLTDFDLSVTLITKKCSLVAINADGGKFVFVFKKDADIQKIIDGYWANEITVNPLEFANARKNLKSRIFGMQKSVKR